MEHVSNYLTEVMLKQKTGIAREHAYRPAFQQLINLLKPDLIVLNDPARSEHGAPDFAFIEGSLTVGYAETKDIGTDLDKEEKGDQMRRYFGYSNLILTNYLEFRFYINGERYGEPISVGVFSDNIVVPKHQNFELLGRTIKDFLESKPEVIKSGERLAKIMGGKARRIRENVFHYISEHSEKSKELFNLYGVMKKLLVHDLSPDQFADMYAQTLVYGLFVARYHDKSPDTFTRQEARDLVPASNPLLRHFFDHIVGPDFDKRLSYIVNELCEIFSVADVKKIMDQYYSKTTLWGETKESPDPVIHFYEDFLREYNPEQRIKLGAFYTPLPVVRFIVSSIDYILKKDFNLKNGLSDSKKIEIPKIVQGKKTKETVHEVQILDPAVGTGTFLNEVIKHIHKSFKNQEGRWSSFVENDLLPRFHGFELMMAPYVIAHLKLGMTLRKFGYENLSKRIGVYLTNSLEEAYKLEGTLFEVSGFMHSITEESREASKIKNEKPIMVVLGNPPYSVNSSNKGQWIQNLIKEYKKDLNEKKLNLDDDYIKFIRFAEYFIEKNGKGIVAMITNNSYIDGVTHRQMRKHLLETFDKIYIFDLHGNMKKKETAPDGGKDENIFDIQQGVSISMFIKKSKSKKGFGKIHHSEIFGLRKYKFDILNKNSVETIKWKNLSNEKSNHFFTPKNLDLMSEYDSGFSLPKMMPIYNSGISTDRDQLFIDFSKDVLSNRIQKLLSNDYDSSFKSKFRIVDSSSYKLTQKVKGKYFNENNIHLIQYRIFDFRYIYYDPSLVSRPAYKIIQNFLKGPNFGLIFKRQAKDEGEYTNFYISKEFIINGLFAIDPLGREVMAPLYLYGTDGETVPNFSKEVIKNLRNVSGIITEENILDYIYSIMYSRSYRSKYKEFLKIDFPRIPYPKNKKTFWKLVEKGKELRLLHLMESPKLQNFITTYPESGSNVVEKVIYENGNVYINETQYFGNVPEIAWNFYIGGYQPAQKWLKDRKSRNLSNEDLGHYQKIIVALIETDKIMREIDTIYLNTEKTQFDT